MIKKSFDHTLIYSILLCAIILIIAFYTIKVIIYFVPAICIGLFIIYVTKPIYITLEKFIKNKTIPIAITITFVILITAFFSIQFITIGIAETSTILGSPRVSNFLSTQYNINTSDLQAEILNSIHYDKIMMLLDRPNMENINELETYSSQIKYTINTMINILFGIGYILLQVIIAFMIAFYGVRDRKIINNIIIKLIPESHKQFIKRVIDEIDLSLNNLFMGLFLNAVITGALAYIIFVYFSIPYPILLATATAIFTLIPIIGAWIIYTPLSIFMFFSGDTQSAITFFMLNLLIVSTIPDWITKPLIIASEKKMNLLLVMIGFIGGGAAFGVIGFILGPIIIAVGVSIIYSFMLETKNDETILTT